MLRSRFLKMCFLFILIGTFAACKQAELKNISAEPETVKIIEKFKNYKNPKVNALMVLNEQEITLKAGKTIERTRVMFKVLNYVGKKFVSTQIIPFNEYTDELNILKARTINPDGTIVDVKKSNIHTESAFSDQPMYTDIKVKKFSFPNVKVGSVVEYEIEKVIDVSKAPAQYGMCQIPGNMTVAMTKFIINVDPSLDLKYKTNNLMSPEPKLEEANGVKTYKWQEEHVWVRGSNDALAPPIMDMGYYVKWTTAKSWDDVYTKVKSLLSFDDSSDKLALKAKEIVSQAKAKTEEEIIRALYKFVSQDINYVGVELGIGAYKPMKPSDVLANMYGDCKGKSALLVAMLKEFGIESYLALALTSHVGHIEESLPAPFFNHAITLIKHKKKWWAVDPTAEVWSASELPFSVEATKVMVIKGNDYEFVDLPEMSAEENRSVDESKVEILPNGNATIETHSKMYGHMAALQRATLTRFNLEDYEKHMKQSIKATYPKAKVLEFEVLNIEELDKPFEILVKVEIKNFAQSSANMMLFNSLLYVPPTFEQLAAVGERFSDINFLHPVKFVTKVEFSVPAGYVLKGAPEALSYNKPYLTYDYKVRRRGKKILASAEIELKNKRLSKGKYARFKSLMDKLSAFTQEKIIIEK